MKFAHPNFLYAFFLLIIPIIIHLFNFRKHKTIVFSNTQFLKQVEQQTKSVSTIKHWILLFTRILLFSALILAFAGPYLPNSDNQQSEEDIVAIYIDNSNSMQMMSTEGVLLSNGLKTAKSIVERSDNKTKFLITSNDFKGAQQRIVSKSDAIDFIDEIKFTPLVKDLQDVFEYQKSFLQEKNKFNNARFVVISDFQKSTTGLPFTNNDSINNSYTPIYINSINTGNLFIDSVWFDTPLRTLNLPNQLYFRVRNTSSEPVNSVGIEFVNGDLTRRQSIDIDANASKIGSLSYLDKIAGIHTCELRVKDKHVTFDDQFYFSYQIQNNLNISIINGSNATNFVERLYQLDSNFIVNSYSYNAVPSDVVNSSNLVVLNELNTISTGLMDQLVDFTENGGSLVILPGEDLDFNQFNKLLTLLKMPNLGNKQQSNVLGGINYKEPFFKNVFEKEEQHVAFPIVKQYYPILGNGFMAMQQLMHYQDKTGFFIKSGQLNKQIYLSSVGLNESFGSFGKHALFSTILLRISELSSSKNPIYCTLNNPSVYRFTVPDDKKDTPIQLILGSNKQVFIPAQKRNGSLIEIYLNKDNSNNQLASGNHLVTYNGKTIGTLSINQDFTESNLETIPVEDLKVSLQQSGFKDISLIEINETQTDFSLKLENRKEYWRILLILALVFLVLEILVIKLMKG